jgi:hypothetical protein
VTPEDERGLTPAPSDDEPERGPSGGDLFLGVCLGSLCAVAASSLVLRFHDAIPEPYRAGQPLSSGAGGMAVGILLMMARGSLLPKTRRASRRELIFVGVTICVWLLGLSVILLAVAASIFLSPF